MCVLVCVGMISQRKYYDVPYPNILLEIEKSTKEYMTTQFEHNKYFTKELKEHSIVLDAITNNLMILAEKFAISNLSMLLLKVCWEKYLMHKLPW